jgi:tRNA A37 methylthiotransferase MiaB
VPKIDIPASTSSPTWATLETCVRDHVQNYLQRVLDEEVEALLDRGRHERRSVRVRTSAANRFKKVERATAIIGRLLRVAEKRVRKRNAPEQCRDVYRGVRYVDGIEVPPVSPTQKAAA